MLGEVIDTSKRARSTLHWRIQWLTTEPTKTGPDPEAWWAGSPTGALRLRLPWWLRWSRICLQCGRPRNWSLSWEDPLEKGMLPTPVFLPGESQGQRSLVGYSPWTLKESDTTERLTLSLSLWGKIESGHYREWRVLERKGRKLEEGRLKDCLSQWCSSFSTYHNHFEDLVKQKARFFS